MKNYTRLCLQFFVKIIKRFQITCFFKCVGFEFCSSNYVITYDSFLWNSFEFDVLDHLLREISSIYL